MSVGYGVLVTMIVVISAIPSIVSAATAEIPVAGTRDPFAVKGNTPSPNLPIASSNQEIPAKTYLTSIETHLLDYTDEGVVTAEVKSRGAQKIVLCINKDAPCTAVYNPQQKKVVFTGAWMDIEGAITHDNFLQVNKPFGLGYSLTIFFLNERVEGTSTTLIISSRFDL
jgi:hypothetical protein